MDSRTGRSQAKAGCTVLQAVSQQGATLVVALIIVLVMGLTAASALQNITLQERMAGNMLDNSIAFHAAEDALLATELWLINTASLPLINYGNGRPVAISVYDGTANADADNDPLTEAELLSRNAAVQDSWSAHAWNATDFGAAGNAGLKQPVQITVEKISSREYLILAQSSGASGKAEVILKAVVVK